uniref:guanylate cyclase n=1 Tax=Panagrellus redivivus TaxID=6233 RepID=A0A7E4VDZ2_PANRE
MFITDSCSVENFGISRLARFWNVPVFLRSDFALTLFDPTMFPTVVHMADMTCISAALAIEKVAEALGRTELTLVGPYLQNQKSESLHIGIYNYLTLLNTVNATHVDLDENNWGSMGDQFLSIRTPVQLIVIDGNFANPNTAFDKMDVRGMVNDGYFVIWICKNAVQQCQADLKERAYDTKILLMSPYYPNWDAIVAQMVIKLGDVYEDQFITEYVNTYTTCYTIAIAYQRTGSSNGQTIANAFKSAAFTNAPFGELLFDANAVRLPSTIFAWKPSQNEPLMEGYVVQTTRAPCANQRCYEANLVTINGTTWFRDRNQVLKECVYSGGCTSYMFIVFIGIGVVMLIAMVAFVIKRQRAKRMNQYKMHWKIPRSMLKVIEKASKVNENIGGGGLSSKRRQIEQYAIYESTKADVITLQAPEVVNWTKDELQYLTELKRLNHDNLINFIGICYNDGPIFYLMYNLVERASLSDFVFDMDFRLDETFKSAFLRDILKGLNYLHRSPVGYHGLLTLDNCLIDANWVLKLTNFGITVFLHKLQEEKVLKLNGNAHLKPELYQHIAPEFLKNLSLGEFYPMGDQQGDVYSFGMILYQIIMRTRPFKGEDLKSTKISKQLFEKIRLQQIMPIVADYAPEDQPLIEIMEQCWKHNPTLRPKVRVLNQVLASAFQSTKGNLVDQMMRMNEKHAANLESIVAERGAMLVEAQEQTDRLLCEILPPTIAEQLKSGAIIEPRSYEAVTVLFCQLVDFLYVQENTNPVQVVEFLNEVFTMFDLVINKHDAYKVETTGETYMVASGVPNENENRHVFEISEVALEFRERSYSYKLAALPEFKLQIRIGYHCGPIAAGVIGLKAPRFCLFGDTVSFVNRSTWKNKDSLESTALQLMVVDEYKLTKRGIVTVKGKGDVNTYWLNEHIHQHPDTNELAHTAAAASALPKPKTPKPGKASPSKTLFARRRSSVKEDKEMLLPDEM